MKRWLLFLQVILLGIVVLVLSARNGSSAEVYICRSGSSYAYHKQICVGLRNCSHRIDKVTLKEAMETGHGKACGHCYR